MIVFCNRRVRHNNVFHRALFKRHEYVSTFPVCHLSRSRVLSGLFKTWNPDVFYHLLVFCQWRQIPENQVTSLETFQNHPQAAKVDKSLNQEFPSLQRLNRNKSRLDLLWLANAWHVVNRLNTPHHWTFIYSFGYIHIHIDISIYLNGTIIFVLMRAHSPGCTQLDTCIYVTHIYKVAQKKNPLITNRTKSYRAFPPFQKSMSFCPWSMQRAWENWVGHSNYHLTKVVQIFLSSPQ